MIFVTGATGFVGSRLVRQLKGEVCALVRGKDPGLKVKQVVGDLNEPSSYMAVIKNCNKIIHLASILDEKNPDLWKVNVEGTKSLLEVCDNQRFIHLSSVGIYGPVSKPADEKTPPNPITKYEKSKLASEGLVKASGLPYTILRPTMVYGPNKYWLAIIKLAKKNFPLIGNGENFFHTVYVNDLVEVIIRSLEKKHVRQDYIIASHELLTLNQTYDIIKEILGVKQKTRHIPTPLAHALSHLTQFLPNSILIPEHVTRLTRNRIYNVKKAEKNGLACMTKFHGGIKEVILNSGV